MYDMYSGNRYFIYEFLSMCLFIYFIVYWDYFEFVHAFMFLMYLVMDHMSWICYDFEHSSSIMSVTGRIIDSYCIIQFYLFILFIYVFFCFVYLFIYLFIFPRR